MNIIATGPADASRSRSDSSHSTRVRRKGCIMIEMGRQRFLDVRQQLPYQ